ncbi:hypothetical protein [Massilia sp. H6]|uniref:hypothetical protein n=1 Tax=Massilia sp. H6 TaxID=2970464 RepID=UPI0021699AEB|nr:hypothetical protein [Massilia sp. H6]UVW27374.1 hypothetical protein NRS07_12470 [Massilia sp. H6]
MKPIPTETATEVGPVGKLLGAAAAGALLMYVLDPERGRARRERALTAVRVAGARTGESVDHALHQAADRLVNLKDSAASALARKRSEHDIERTIEHDRQRDMAGRNSYQKDRHYAARQPGERQRTQRDDPAQHERGGLSNMLHGMADSLGGARGSHQALLGGGVVGLIGLVRRSPMALLAGLAGIYLLTRGASTRTYRVNDMARGPAADELETAPFVPANTEQGKHYLH